MEIRVSLQYAGFSSVGAALCSLRIQTGDKAAGCLFMACCSMNGYIPGSASIYFHIER